MLRICLNGEGQNLGLPQNSILPRENSCSLCGTGCPHKLSGNDVAMYLEPSGDGRMVKFER